MLEKKISILGVVVTFRLDWTRQCRSNVSRMKQWREAMVCVLVKNREEWGASEKSNCMYPSKQESRRKERVDRQQKRVSLAIFGDSIVLYYICNAHDSLMMVGCLLQYRNHVLNVNP